MIIEDNEQLAGSAFVKSPNIMEKELQLGVSSLLLGGGSRFGPQMMGWVIVKTQ